MPHISLATLNLKDCIRCGRCSGGCPVSMRSRLNVWPQVETPVRNVLD